MKINEILNKRKAMHPLICSSYKPSEHRMTQPAFELLDQFRHKSMLCDATIEVDDGTRYPVHRVILSASSRYFRALFTNGLAETNITLIVIQAIDTDIMGLLLDWIYTKDISINSNNIERLLVAADKFDEGLLRDKCVQFLELNIDCDNVVGIWRFARFYHINTLAESAFTYLMENFLSVLVCSQEIFEINKLEAAKIIRCNDLNVKSEHITLGFINRWVNFDRESRGQVTKNINSICEGYNLIQSLFPDDTSVVGFKGLRLRVPHEILIAVGGWTNGSPSSSVEIYNSRKNEWTLYKQLFKSPLAYHGSVTLGKCLFVIGGYDGTDFLSDCKMLNFATARWIEIAPMHQKRCYVSTAVLNGKIYALGGFDGLIRFNTCEVYSPETNQWSMLASMNEARSDSSAVELGGKLYICGGFNGVDYLSSVESYDPETNEWTFIRSMSCKRSGVGVVSYHGGIYVMGGYDGDRRLETCEKYLPIDDEWKRIADMKSPRSNFGIDVLEDNVYVIGGFNGFTTIFGTEYYVEENNQWLLKAKMNGSRSAVSACTLKGIKYIKPYL